MDYGTYLAKKKALLAKVRDAHAACKRTSLHIYLEDMHKYRDQMEILDEANPTCAKMFMESQQRRAEAVR